MIRIIASWYVGTWPRDESGNGPLIYEAMSSRVTGVDLFKILGARRSGQSAITGDNNSVSGAK